jgi:hypothetical protein
MTTPSVAFFCIAALFYVFTWVYIRQLVREVNSEPSGRHISVRQRLAGCIALTVTLGLIAFAIEVRLILLRY